MVAETERRRAEDAKAVEAAVSGFLGLDLLGQATGVAQIGRGYAPDPGLTVRTVLDRAARTVGYRFRDRPAVEAVVRWRIGESYFVLASYEKAKEHLEIAEPLTARAFGRHGLEHLAVLEALAKAVYFSGQYLDGIERYKRFLAALEAARPADHPDVLDALRLMAHLEWANHDHRSGIEYQERVAAAQVRRFGPDHPDAILDAIQVILYESDPVAIAAAIPAFRRAIEANSAGRRQDDEQVARWYQSLGEAYRYADQTEESIRCFERVRDVYTRLYGKENALTLSVGDQLSDALFMAGHRKQGLDLLQELYGVRSRLLGPAAEKTLVSARDLALFLWLDGQKAESLRVAEDAYKTARRALGPFHPVAADITTRLIEWLEAHGRGDRAAAVESELLADLREAARAGRTPMSQWFGRRFAETGRRLLQDGKGPSADTLVTRIDQLLVKSLWRQQRFADAVRTALAKSRPPAHTGWWPLPFLLSKSAATANPDPVPEP